MKWFFVVWTVFSFYSKESRLSWHTPVFVLLRVHQGSEEHYCQLQPQETWEPIKPTTVVGIDSTQRSSNRRVLWHSLKNNKNPSIYYLLKCPESVQGPLSLLANPGTFPFLFIMEFFSLLGKRRNYITLYLFTRERKREDFPNMLIKWRRERTTQ